MLKKKMGGHFKIKLKAMSNGGGRPWLGANSSGEFGGSSVTEPCYYNYYEEISHYSSTYDAREEISHYSSTYGARLRLHPNPLVKDLASSQPSDDSAGMCLPTCHPDSHVLQLNCILVVSLARKSPSHQTHKA
jgi:hypothetical protein